eukprot:758249-Prorocentrum_minimum.AAC.1
MWLSRASGVDVKDYKVDVKDYEVDVKGYGVDIEGTLPLRARHAHVVGDRGGPCRLPPDGHPVRVPSERCDVVLDPLEGHPLVQHA